MHGLVGVEPFGIESTFQFNTTASLPLEANKEGADPCASADVDAHSKLSTILENSSNGSFFSADSNFG